MLLIGTAPNKNAGTNFDPRCKCWQCTTRLVAAGNNYAQGDFVVRGTGGGAKYYRALRKHIPCKRSCRSRYIPNIILDPDIWVEVQMLNVLVGQLIDSAISH